MPYDLQSVRAPRIAGLALSAAASLFENPVTNKLLLPKLLRDAGVERFRAAVLAEAPSVTPSLPRPASRDARSSTPIDLGALAASPVGKGFRFETVADFARAFRDGTSDPLKVAERVIAAIARSNEASPPLRAIIASRSDEIVLQAKASAARFQAGQPLGPLDGVPVAVKDELDVLGYPTTAGTSFLKRIASEDATVVQRLKAAGALIIGKANMHEIGIDTTGFNPHHGTARNPYDPRRYTGGSSSGSAAAVGAGLCPLAVGADGGGSIRIPAALCGIVGLKATWSRISEAGAFPLCWSVAHVGPIGATARDVALGYALMAGPDPRDVNSGNQPALELDGFDKGVAGLKLGVYTPWFDHASPEVARVCHALLGEFEKQGATLVEIELEDLELCRVAHAVTILSEMATTMDQYDELHRSDLGLGVRLNLALAREMTGRDYVRAQQVRTRFSANVEKALAKCDAIMTPTTGIVAPEIAADVLPRGESNLDVTSAMMRFVFPANLTGHPAISFPAGHDGNGIPVGMQAMGRAWDESLLLRIAQAAEGIVERRPPQVMNRLLG